MEHIEIILWIVILLLLILVSSFIKKTEEQRKEIYLLNKRIKYLRDANYKTYEFYKQKTKHGGWSR